MGCCASKSAKVDDATDAGATPVTTGGDRYKVKKDLASGRAEAAGGSADGGMTKTNSMKQGKEGKKKGGVGTSVSSTGKGDGMGGMGGSETKKMTLSDNIVGKEQDVELVSSDDDHESSDDEEAHYQHGQKLVYIIGPPGSGKSVMLRKLKVEFSSFCLIDLSDLLATSVNSGKEERAEEIAKCLVNGSAVDADLAVRIVQRHLTDSGITGGSGSLVLEGFPQSVAQAEAFGKRVCKCTLLIVLECSREVCMSRIAVRSSRFADDVDDIDAQSGAFDAFEKSMPAIVEYIRKTGAEVVPIDASAPVDEVWQTAATVVTKTVTRMSSKLQRSFRSIHLPDQDTVIDLRENSIRIKNDNVMPGARRLSVQEVADIGSELGVMKATESRLALGVDGPDDNLVDVE